MTLAQRLLLAIGALTVAVLVVLGFGVREAWRQTEERTFEERSQEARNRLEQDLSERSRDFADVITPLCRDDPGVDSALIGLKANSLDERRIPISRSVPATAKARRLDELFLLTAGGEILGANLEGFVGKRDPALAKRVSQLTQSPVLRTDRSPRALEFACVRRDSVSPDVWVGLYAAYHLDPLLERIGTGYGFTLSLEPPQGNPNELVSVMRLPAFGNVPVTATRSREPLAKALEKLDFQILLIGGVTLAMASVLVLLLSRGLARPFVALAEQARQVSHGELTPVIAQGPRELVEAAEAFNQAIADLSALRKRLAATERIAARREIARRVAHEIKNPLAPIRAAVETLRRLRARNDPAFDEYFDEATRTVLGEVSRIANIVQQFTRFARLPPPNPAPMDIVETIRSVVGLHDTGSVPIHFQAESCPEVNADRDQVVQIATNLLQNAVQAVSGREGARVDVELWSSGDKVELSVRDNGPGLADEMRDRLFEPYATTKAEGTGLGLAIVHRIVVEHGGEISYRDARGGGAEFRVELPITGPTLLPEPPDPLEHA